MGKWSHLKKGKKKIPVFQQEPTWQAKIDLAKNEYLIDKNGVKQKPDKVILAAQFRIAKVDKDRAEEIMAEVNTRLEALSQLLVSMLEDEDITSFKMSDGTLVGIRDDVYVSMEDRPAFEAWVKKHKMKDLFSVNYQTAAAVTKGLLEEGKPLPPGLKVFLKSGISVRKGEE